VTAPASWLLFAAALAAEGMLRVAVVGLPDLELSENTPVLAAPLYIGLVLFGLVRLGGLVTGLHAARTELAALAVAQERLRAAGRLRAAHRGQRRRARRRAGRGGLGGRHRRAGGAAALPLYGVAGACQTARLGGEDALAAGDPAHGVDEVVGGTVLDQEP
jgi:hypothetical protein